MEHWLTFQKIEILPPSRVVPPMPMVLPFTLFSKMPVELRRKIRHATFRLRRHVWSCEDGIGPGCKLVGFAHLLVALSVNKGLDTLRIETNILKAVDLESFARITSRNQLLTSSANFNIWRLRSGVSSLSEVNIILPIFQRVIRSTSRD